jgi:hypothetical protein
VNTVKRLARWAALLLFIIVPFSITAYAFTFMLTHNTDAAIAAEYAALIIAAIAIGIDEDRRARAGK